MVCVFGALWDLILRIVALLLADALWILAAVSLLIPAAADLLPLPVADLLPVLAADLLPVPVVDWTQFHLAVVVVVKSQLRW